MGGKVIASLISCVMLSFLVVVTVSFYIFAANEERVTDICYDYAETVSTKGMLSSEVYDSFAESLSKYGDYTIVLKLETVDERGAFDFTFDKGEILNRELKTGDVITIAVYGQDPSLAEKLTGSLLRVCAVKTAYIT